jgi:hypothetical protein
MKSTTKSKTCMTVASVILATALAIPAAAQKQVPFKGTIQGQDSDKGFTSPGLFLVESNGTGNGILLGRFTFKLETTINVAESTDTGSAHFEAANGDTIDATYTSTRPAQVQPTPDGVVFSIQEIYTITGGTGRFAGAQGSFVMDRVADPQKFITFGSFSGSITPPGAAH